MFSETDAPPELDLSRLEGPVDGALIVARSGELAQGRTVGVEKCEVDCQRSSDRGCRHLDGETGVQTFGDGNTRPAVQAKSGTEKEVGGGATDNSIIRAEYTSSLIGFHGPAVKISAIYTSQYHGHQRPTRHQDWSPIPSIVVTCLADEEPRRVAVPERHMVPLA